MPLARGKFLCTLLLLSIYALPQIRSVQNSTSSVSSIDSKAIESLPFSKGNFELGLQTIGAVNHLNDYSSDIKTGYTNEERIGVEFTKFYWNNIGIGADLQGRWNGFHDINSDKQTMSRYSLGLHAAYGFNISNNISGLIKAGPEFTWNKDESQSGTDNSSISGHGVGFDVGFSLPIRTCENNYISPEICYDYCHTTYPSYTVTGSRFGVGVRIVEYMPCASYTRFDYKKTPLLSMYDRGENFINYGTGGRLQIGSNEQKYNGISNKTNTTKIDFSADYGHYFFNNFAIGVDLSMSSSTDKIMNDKSTSTQFLFYPLVRYNLPFYPPLYIQGEYGFGTDKVVSTSNGSSTSDKFNVSGYLVAVGDNIPLNNSVFWNVQIGYGSTMYKIPGNSNSSNDSKEKGISGFTGIGIRF